MRVQFRQDPKERERYVAESNYAQHKAELSNQRKNNVSKTSTKIIITAGVVIAVLILLVVLLVSFLK